MIRDNISKSIKGAGALSEALELIGSGKDDHDMAKIITENELELREFLKWGLNSLASEQ